MSKREKATKTARSRPSDDAVADVFAAYPPPLRRALLALRQLILDTAAATDGVGPLQETLKWGQPSYLTAQSGSGTTIRIDALKDEAGGYALYVNCRTDLIDSFRALYPTELRFAGNRAVLFNAADPLPVAATGHCIALALTYHQRKRRRRASTAPAVATR